MKDFLKKAFPFIATAIGTVGGPLGQTAAAALGKALGVDKTDPTPGELAAAFVNATPEQIAAAQAAEHDFQLKMQQAGYEHVEDMAKIDAGDRASARAREIAVRDRIPAILALSITFGFFGLLFLIVFYPLPDASQKVLDIMIGTLGTAWVGVVTYYFGSSAGSAAKTALLAEKGK